MVVVVHICGECGKRIQVGVVRVAGGKRCVGCHVRVEAEKAATR